MPPSSYFKPAAFAACLFSKRHEQSVTNVAQARFDHTLPVDLFIAPANPHLDALLPLSTRRRKPLFCSQDGDNQDALNSVLLETVDGSAGGGTGSDDGVNDDGELCGAADVGVGGCGGVIGQVVVVFYGLECLLLAEETKVVDRHGCGEERGECRDHGEAGAEDGHQ
jgi:hypothetical protein